MLSLHTSSQLPDSLGKYRIISQVVGTADQPNPALSIWSREVLQEREEGSGFSVAFGGSSSHQKHKKQTCITSWKRPAGRTTQMTCRLRRCHWAGKNNYSALMATREGRSPFPSTLFCPSSFALFFAVHLCERYHAAVPCLFSSRQELLVILFVFSYGCISDQNSSSNLSCAMLHLT